MLAPDDIKALAAATFHEFFPFINVRDCGKKILDKDGAPTPIHMITQEAYRYGGTYWNLSHEERKQFKPTYETGKRKGKEFRAGPDYFGRFMKAAKIKQHILGKDTYYYTSAKHKFALPYMDIDAHDGQMDELEAKRLLLDINGCSLWNPSSRGQNGYFKLSYGRLYEPCLDHSCFATLSQSEKVFLQDRIEAGLTPQQVNALFDRAQEAYCRYLDFHGIECTFEIKGKVAEYTKNPIDDTLDIKSGSLAKFPFKGWSWERLDEFKRLPIVNWYVWEWHIRELERILDKKEAVRGITGAAASGGTQSPAATDVCEGPSAKVEPKECREQRKRRQCSDDGAFRRNHKDCKPFVREFYRLHGRTPEHTDFLDHLRVNELYSGEWNDPNSDRESRTKRVLDFTLKGFDPDKLGNGEGRLPVLTWLRQYATNQFGELRGEVEKGTELFIESEDGLEAGVRNQQCRVPARFVRHCVCVILTCIEDIAENDGLPENRIVKAWSLLPSAPSWNRDYYAIVRRHLEDRGIVDIYDKNHRANKCWRWKKGPNYPLSPEKIEQEMKRIKACKTGSVLRTFKTCNCTARITPYYKIDSIIVFCAANEAILERPPP